MRIVNKTLDNSISIYKRTLEYERENNLTSSNTEALTSVFLISQNLPLTEVSDIFSGFNFSLLECYEELESSLELIRLGFFKQSMMSLRAALDIGLLSIYWNLVGKESSEFKAWLNSKLDTPYKNLKFWNTLLLNEKIKIFNEKFDLFNEIQKIDLSNFIHTKGKKYSNQQKFKFYNIKHNFQEYNLWLSNFQNVVKYIEILHLLLFPTLNLRYTTEFLLKKFGNFNKIPISGVGYGEEMYCLYTFIPESQKIFIIELAETDKEVIYLKNYLSELKDLTPDEIQKLKDNEIDFI